MNNSVVAGIVCYNPDITRLEYNLLAIHKQVETVIVIDNHSDNLKAIEELLKRYPNVEIVKNRDNKGVSFALNQIGDIAENRKFGFFLTLDQDSVVCAGLVDKLLDCFSDTSIGITCPVLSSNNYYIRQDKKYEVAFAITSGSLIRTEAWKTVGGFWDFLFVDEVDHEFCYAIRRKGYHIIQNNEVVLNHIIGLPISKKILWHTCHSMNHNAFRKYYIARNNIIVKHLYPDEKEPYSHRYLRTLRMAADIIVLEKNKREKMKALSFGIKEGVAWCRKNNGIKQRRTSA